MAKSKSKSEMIVQLRIVDARRLKGIFRYTDHAIKLDSED